MTQGKFDNLQVDLKEAYIKIAELELNNLRLKRCLTGFKFGVSKLTEDIIDKAIKNF